MTIYQSYGELLGTKRTLTDLFAALCSWSDVLTVSRRLGHGTPVVTLNTYAHLFEKTDSLAATAIEALQTKIEH